MALVFVLGALFSLMILVFSLSRHSLTLRDTTISILEEEYAFETSFLTTRVLWTFLDEVFRCRNGCEKLFPKTGAKSSSDPIPRDLLKGITITIKDLEEKDKILKTFQLICQKFNVKNVDAKIEFRNVKEKADFYYGIIEVSIGLDFNRFHYQFAFPREFRLYQILPKVVSKFSLFVRESPPNENDYNIIAKNFQEDSGAKKPLYLFNSQTTGGFAKTNTDLWKNSGWVYLGGQKPITLNLDGSHPVRKESDFFIFWPTQVSGMDTSVPAPSIISDYFSTKYKLKIRFTPWGCTQDFGKIWCLMMNVGPEITELLVNSSFLRLFGSKDKITPTKIFGKVFARWVLFANFVYDTNGDGKPEQIQIPPISVNQEPVMIPGVFMYPRISEDKFNPTLKEPQILSISSKFMLPWGEKIWQKSFPDIPLSAHDLFPNYQNYKELMTKVSREDFPEPYTSFNKLYDQVFSESYTGKFIQIPTMLSLFREGQDYPDLGDDIEDLKLQGRNIWNNDCDLSRFDPAKVYENPEYPLTIFETGNNLPFEKERTTSIIKKPFCGLFKNELVLPSLKVKAPAILIAENNIRVGNIESDPEGLLVLVSLKGSIILENSNRIDSTALIAPQGTIVYGKGAAPINISGTVCVKELKPENLSQVGGSITYDSKFDPTNPEKWSQGFTFITGPEIAGTIINKDFLRPE